MKPTQLALGETIYSASEKSFKNLEQTDFDSSQNPALNAGWPQHVWFVLYDTLHPAFSNTLTMLKAV
jgi:hypothetical protein